MKLYLLTQYQNTGYDTYDSCVVCAENEDDAKNIDPSTGDGVFVDWSNKSQKYSISWANTKDGIEVEEIGEAHPSQKRGVICASFNAG